MHIELLKDLFSLSGPSIASHQNILKLASVINLTVNIVENKDENTGVDPILHHLGLPYDEYANDTYHSGTYTTTQEAEIIKDMTAFTENHPDYTLQALDHRAFLLRVLADRIVQGKDKGKDKAEIGFYTSFLLFLLYYAQILYHHLISRNILALKVNHLRSKKSLSVLLTALVCILVSIPVVNIYHIRSVKNDSFTKKSNTILSPQTTKPPESQQNVAAQIPNNASGSQQTNATNSKPTPATPAPKNIPPKQQTSTQPSAPQPTSPAVTSAYMSHYSQCLGASVAAVSSTSTELLFMLIPQQASP